MKAVKVIGLALVTCVMVLVGGSRTSYSQPRTLCDDGLCAVPWTHFVFSKNIAGCTVNVDGEYRVCAGVLQFRYGSQTKTGVGCSLLKDSTLWQLVDLFLIQESQDPANPTPGIPALPDCPGGVQQVQFITTACYIWQDCKYNTNNGRPSCSPPYPPAGPAPVVDVWYWNDCGTTCCERLYNVCKDTSPTAPASGIQVTIMSKTRLGAGCTLEPLFTPVGCSDGC
jgi:hypothetical protein